MGRTFCIANQKGGVGKTTTSINLATALARAGQHTLLVDMDPQCNATSGIGQQPVDRHPLVVDQALRHGVLSTDVERLDLLPGSKSFRDLSLLASDDSKDDELLIEHLANGAARYDYVLIDCPPSLGKLTLSLIHI